MLEKRKGHFPYIQTDKFSEVFHHVNHDYLPHQLVAVWVSLRNHHHQSFGDLHVHRKLKRNMEMTNQIW